MHTFSKVVIGAMMAGVGLTVAGLLLTLGAFFLGVGVLTIWGMFGMTCY